jgi:hypothetical protein
MTGMSEWLERWPQYADTVPDELRYEEQEKQIHYLAKVVSDVACTSMMSYNQAFSMVRSVMIAGALPYSEGFMEGGR